MFSKKTTTYLLYICTLCVGCNRSVYTKTGEAGLQQLDTSFTTTSAKADKLINPYHDQIQQEMGEIVGFTSETMVKSRPEGALGNAVSDLILTYTRELLDSSTMVCIMNHGGLRAPLPKGKITKGKVYELMPFDNTITILSLNATDMKSLANHIVSRGGEPIGGISHAKITTTSNSSTFVFEQDSFNNKQVYTVVTSNYLADGGDNFSIFKNALSRNDTPILIRDALLYAFKNYTSEANPLDAEIEGRIELENE